MTRIETVAEVLAGVWAIAESRKLTKYSQSSDNVYSFEPNPAYVPLLNVVQEKCAHKNAAWQNKGRLRMSCPECGIEWSPTSSTFLPPVGLKPRCWDDMPPGALAGALEEAATKLPYKVYVAFRDAEDPQAEDVDGDTARAMLTALQPAAPMSDIIVCQACHGEGGFNRFEQVPEGDGTGVRDVHQWIPCSSCENEKKSRERERDNMGIEFIHSWYRWALPFGVIYTGWNSGGFVEVRFLCWGVTLWWGDE